jgi:hypothetical protein
MSSWFKRGGSAEPANAAAAQGQPLLLIGFNDSTQKWEVGQDALKALRSISGPLSTISVCGRARQGKSFLLNQMINRLTGVEKAKGFVVSPTQQSCTRGIWMWSHPVQIPGPDGRKCNTVSLSTLHAVPCLATCCSCSLSCMQWKHASGPGQCVIMQLMHLKDAALYQILPAGCLSCRS